MERSESPPLSRRERRRRLETILDSRDHAALRLWAETARSPLSVLSAALFSGDPLRCWRAIEALGLTAALVARTDLEAVRNLIRHNFWMMNDESGNVGWHAPETIGEALYRVPVLIDEYAGRLPAYSAEEPFERGTFWAVARVASIRPDAFKSEVAPLAAATTHADPVIRYRALAALAHIDRAAAVARAHDLRGDTGAVAEYDLSTGQLAETSPAALANSILNASSE